MHLLVPISESIKLDFQDYVGNNLPVSTDAIAAILVRALGSHRSKILRESLELLHGITQEIYSANLQKVPLNWLVENLQSKSTPTVMERPHFEIIFQDIERCDNRIVADRVTIFSNFAGLRQRLVSTTLSSYSLSILSLLWGNGHLPEVLLVHTTQAPIKNPFKRATIGLFLETYYSLKKLFQESGIGKLQELENTKLVLQRAFPVEMTRYASLHDLLEENASLDDLLKELKIKAQQDIETYLSSQVLSDVILAPILPMGCTIAETLGGIIHWLSPDRKEVEAYHGESIIKYGVSSGQLAKGSNFVAFYGTYCWRPAFMNEVLKE